MEAITETAEESSPMPKVVPSVEGAAQKYLLTEENAPKDAPRSTRVALGELKQSRRAAGRPSAAAS